MAVLRLDRRQDGRATSAPTRCRPDQKGAARRITYTTADRPAACKLMKFLVRSLAAPPIDRLFARRDSLLVIAGDMQQAAASIAWCAASQADAPHTAGRSCPASPREPVPAFLAPNAGRGFTVTPFRLCHAACITCVCSSSWRTNTLNIGDGTSAALTSSSSVATMVASFTADPGAIPSRLRAASSTARTEPA